MMMAIQKKLYTVQEFEAFLAQAEHADPRFELIHGEIVEQMPTEQHGIIARNILVALHTYVKANKLGRVVSEVRYLMGDAGNVRVPDVTFTLEEHVQPVVEKGPTTQLPDLAVEVKSPDDSILSLREKADFYLEQGIQLVWLVYPEKHLVEAYSADGIEIYLDGDTLTGGPLLPDFSLRVRDIFEV